jgi:hypothetical protein
LDGRRFATRFDVSPDNVSPDVEFIHIDRILAGVFTMLLISGRLAELNQRGDCGRRVRDVERPAGVHRDL